MDNETTFVQRLKRSTATLFEKAYTYYSIINSLNNLKLTHKQLQLLAFTALRGTISSPSAKNEFIKQYGSSIDSINNMISKMYKKKLLYKVDSKIKVNSVILPNFNQDILLNISLGLVAIKDLSKEEVTDAK